MDDWCIAVAEQTIFLAHPKSAVIEIGPDHARGWRRDTLAHTWRNITEPQKDSFWLAKLEGPRHKHWRQPQGRREEVESPQTARLHLLNI